jgi:uncharacterized membrane protein YhhN
MMIELPAGTAGVFFWIFASLFVLVSIIHLVFCYFEMEMYRRWSKPFCMATLTLALIFLVPAYPLIYVGTFLGLIGDIFMIWKHRKVPLAFGIIFFLLGHMAYIAHISWFLTTKGDFGWPYYVGGAFIVLAITLGFYPFSVKRTKNGYLATLGNFYLGFLTLVPLAALCAVLLGYTDFMFLTVIGGISFVLSDTILIYTIFIKDIKRRDFFIMVFYLVGQALIVSGLALTVLAY